MAVEKRSVERVRNPLIHSGTSQYERLLESLVPSYFKIDDRSTKDLINASFEYAGLLKYYDNNNVVKGDWSCFWKVEMLTLLAKTASLNVQNILDKYQAIKYSFISSSDALSGAEYSTLQKNYHLNLIEYIRDLAIRLQELMHYLPNDLPLRQEIISLIGKDSVLDTEEMSSSLTTLIGYHKEAYYRVYDENLEVEHYQDFVGDHWGIANIDAFYNDIDPSDQYLNNDQEALDSLIRSFHQVYTRVVHRASYWFDKNMATPQLRQPHIALFLTFLKLFEHAREDLNALTEKHLQFYYNQILCMHPGSATPDDAHLTIELASTVDRHLIEKGTRFLGGQDQSGRPLFYKTLEDWFINKARVKEIKTSYIDINDNLCQEPTKMLQSPNVFLAFEDGLELPNEKLDSWRPGGDNKDLPDMKLGFAIASPQLILREGQRTINVDITITLPEQDLELIADQFDLSLSTKAGWLQVKNEGKSSDANSSARDTNDTGQDVISFQITLNRDHPAIESFEDSSITPRSKWPMLRVLFKSDAALYEKLRPLSIKEIEITVDVKGIRENLIIQNDEGVFNGTQKFYPFGAVPAIGDKFYIGSTEAFQKKIEEGTLRFNWIDPPPDFNEHYRNYFKNGRPVTAEPKLKTDFLYQANFEAALDEVNLIVGNTINKEFGLSSLGEDRDPRTQDFAQYFPTLNSGFLRFTLSNADFLHEEFQNSLSIKTIEVAREEPIVLKNIRDRLASLNDTNDTITANELRDILAVTSDNQLPNPPYTPATNSISLDYRSTQVIREADNKGIDQFFHICPFHGYDELSIDKPSSAMNLVPQFDLPPTNNDSETSLSKYANANLYISLEDLTPGNAVSLLFQIQEGSERNPDIDAPAIQWCYLSADNQWEPLSPQHIIRDTTFGLGKTGIIQLLTPTKMSKQTTLFEGNCYWIKAAIAEDEETSVSGFPNIVDIKAQAISVQFSDNNNELGHLVQPLPKGKIKQLQVSQSAVKKIEQPFPTMNGRIPEAGNAFYVRVSERLRHRDRAVQVYDYERLLLEKFPKVLRAKCLTHTKPGSAKACSNELVMDQEYAPGYVTIAVIPHPKDRIGGSLSQPRFSKGDLKEMENYLITKTNLFLKEIENNNTKLRVVNPIYEEVQFVFNVKFKKGQDPVARKYDLDLAIQAFLAPWIYTPDYPMVFGQALKESSAILFLEQLPYVESISDFEFCHGGELKPEVIPATQRSILTTTTASEPKKFAHCINETKHNCTSNS